MSHRQGEIDPWFGQRTAFPLSDNHDQELDAVNKYLENVRHEARALAMEPLDKNMRKRPKIWQEPDCLDYGDATTHESKTDRVMSRENISPLRLEKIKETTLSILHSPSDHELIKCENLIELFHKGRESYLSMDAEHPGRCTSSATWKAYASHNMPVPLNHTNIFRLYKYSLKWNFSGESHYVWAWSLLLRTPLLLTADEMSALRELCRGMGNKSEVWSRAIVTVVSEVYGQHDLSL